MDISDLAFRLLVLFLPGIIAVLLVLRFTVHRPLEFHLFTVYSLIFGFASYFVYWLIEDWVNFCWPKLSDGRVSFLSTVEKGSSRIDYPEIGWAAMVAVVLAGLYSVAENRKWFSRLARWIRVTSKTGELDVWGYVMNSKDVGWIAVRDHGNDLMYQGWVTGFSDNGIEAELLLQDVSVYRNTTGEELYQTGMIYLARDRKTISIEFPEVEIGDSVKWRTNEGELDDERQREQSSTTAATDGGDCEEGRS
jgi:hypothetical protein